MKIAWLGCLVAAAVLAACGGDNGAPAIPPGTAPPEANASLQQILSDCWHVTELRQIDATRPEHVTAFGCGKERLQALAQQYPQLPEAHRMLAWGYYYSRPDDQASVEAARGEYEKAALIYERDGKQVEAADAYRRVGLLTPDRAQACQILLKAAALDPQNALTQSALRNDQFRCATPAPAGPGPNVPPPSTPSR